MTNRKRKKTSAVTLDHLVDELKELRLLRDQADARFLLRLYEIEQDHLQLLLDAGYGCFEDFVRTWTRASRYGAFKLGLLRIGRDRALRLGSHATSVAAKLTDRPDSADKYVEAVMNWSDAHNDQHPSYDEAAHLLKQVDPRAQIPRANKQAQMIAQLRAENAELRAQNRTLQQQLRSLEDKLRKTRGRGRGRAVAPTLS